MDIRFWSGATTRCTVAQWNNDAPHEPWSKLYLPLDGSPRYAVARSGEALRWTDLKPGCLYLVPGGRRQVNVCTRAFTLVWCHFTLQGPELQGRIAAQDGILALPADLLPGCRSRIEHCCASEACRHAASALVHEVLSRLPDPVDDQLADERRRLVEAVRFLEAKFHRHPSIREIASRADLAPSRFRDLFRAAYGTSVHNYRLSLRMSEAKRLLSADGRPIQEIAALCGYPNPFSFTRMFTRRCGMSPLRWRKRSGG